MGNRGGPVGAREAIRNAAGEAKKELLEGVKRRYRAQAREAASAWIERSPESPYAYFQLAEFQETPEDKQAALVAAYERLPRSGVIVKALERSYRALGDHQGATRLVEEFAAVNPDPAVAYELLHQHHSRAQNAVRAWEVLQE